MGDLWRDSIHGVLYPETDAAVLSGVRATALVVGLDPMRASALIRMLAPLARTRLAPDLNAALDMARVLQPDLIVVGADAGAEGVGQALDALNAEPALEDIPVIVLATRDEDDSRRSALRGGALAWLPYTADTGALHARVRLALRMRRHGLAQRRAA